MELRELMVYVPTQAEQEAGRATGVLSLEYRAALGAAAVTAGDPNHSESDAVTSTTDAVANALHWLVTQPDVDDIAITSVLDGARMHLEAELGCDGS